MSLVTAIVRQGAAPCGTQGVLKLFPLFFLFIEIVLELVVIPVGDHGLPRFLKVVVLIGGSGSFGEEVGLEQLLGSIYCLPFAVMKV